MDFKVQKKSMNKRNKIGNATDYSNLYNVQCLEGVLDTLQMEIINNDVMIPCTITVQNNWSGQAEEMVPHNFTEFL